MLTIGQLAGYAGVTVRAVRHYHPIGLLPEPERDASGYRKYDAPAVVSLIKIRTLADAGVPLGQIGPMRRPTRTTSPRRSSGSTTACATRSTGWKPVAGNSRTSPPGTAWCFRRRSWRISTGCGRSRPRSG